MEHELALALTDATFLNDMVCSWLILERLRSDRDKRSFQIETLAIEFKEIWREAEYKMHAYQQINQRRSWPLRFAPRVDLSDVTPRLQQQIRIMSRVLIEHEDPVFVKLTS